MSEKRTETTALEYMAMPGRLRFGADGVWYHDGVSVSHEGVARYFSEHLERDPSRDVWVVRSGSKCVEVEVEDVPWVGLTIDTSSDTWQIKLHTGTWVGVGVQGFFAAPDRYYASVHGLAERVRLKSAAVQALLPYIVRHDNGSYEVCGERCCYPIWPLPIDTGAEEAVEK